MRIHHIGYLVDDIQAAIEEMSKLGFVSVSEIKNDEFRKIKVAFLDNDGYRVELVQPINETSPIFGLRKKHKNSPYHICYITETFKDDIDNLCNGGGFMIINKPEEAPAIEGSPRVAFLMSGEIGMIELVEVKGEENVR